MNLPESDPVAAAIAAPARVETRSTYADAVDEFEARGYTYVPLPADGEYYHVGEGWFGDLRAEQFVAPDTHLVEVLERLRDNPFLLVEYGPEPGSDPEEPTDASREGEYGIVTVSDVNKRPTHEMIYPVVAELASLVAGRIESRYDSEELFDHLEDRTVGAWVKDERRNVHLHIAESMDLGEMQQVLRASNPDLAKSCGFDSTDDLDDLNRIRDLRNRVMHANRSLVRTRDDVDELLDTVRRAAELIERANDGAAFS